MLAATVGANDAGFMYHWYSSVDIAFVEQYVVLVVVVVNLNPLKQSLSPVVIFIYYPSKYIYIYIYR